MSALRLSRYLPRIWRFAFVGALGIFVNELALVIFHEGIGINYLVAAILATQASSTFNFIGIEGWVYGERREPGAWKRFAAFLAVNNALLLLRVPALWLLTDGLGIHYAASNLITLIALFLTRFAVSDKFIWRASRERRSLVGVGPGIQPEFQYNVAGVLSVHSDFELRELSRFRAEKLDSPDIRIVRAAVGRWPQRAIRFEHDGEKLEYTEHLGGVGANFSIRMGKPIEIRVNGLLGRSPHVLYTNVVEALLRFLLVSRGYVLLHSACLAYDGGASIFSAQTDTGKTSTVIRLVRERNYAFMADDMIVLSPTGSAISYPKPMTLSYHTLSAIAGKQLEPRERLALAVRSRVHSKSGRSVGQGLGRLNIPIMSINALVQMTVPPPKYHIDALFDAAHRGEAPIRKVFLMGRGEWSIDRVGLDDALPTLIENTDDAYGFPPFATFAPRLVIDGMDYQTLRARELELLRASLANAEFWRIQVPGHEWSDVLPELIEDAKPAVEVQQGAPVRRGVPAEVRVLQ